jgi:integrase
VDEVRSVITAAREIDPAASVALRLAAVAGCRRAELAALRWDDLEDQRLTIDSSVTQRRGAEGGSELLDEPTKTANRRTVHLDPATVAETVALRHQREVVSPYMFSFDAGPAPASRIGWWWSRARAIAGIDPSWRLHDLRHWSATVAISSGTDVRTVAGRLGHANAAMTLRVYAHSVEAADRTLGEQLVCCSTMEPAADRSYLPSKQPLRMRLGAIRTCDAALRNEAGGVPPSLSTAGCAGQIAGPVRSPAQSAQRHRKDRQRIGQTAAVAVPVLAY